VCRHRGTEIGCPLSSEVVDVLRESSADVIEAAGARGPAATTRLAWAAVLVLGLIPFLALNFHDGRQQLGDEGLFLRHQASDDSWGPIALALKHVERRGADGLYQDTYYRSAAQFIYSPLSLVLFRWGKVPGILDWHDPKSIDRVSWWIVVLTAVGAAAVMLSAGPPLSGAGGATEGALRVALACLATWLFHPVIRAYTVGNLQSWLNCAYVFAILFWVRRVPFASGFLLGIASVVKPQMSLFLIWALLRREKAFALGMLAAVVPLGVISLVAFGWPVHAEYLALVRHLSGRGEAYFSSQCMNALLNRMFFIGNNLEWDGSHASIPYNGWVHLATSLSSLAFIVPALFWRHREGKRRDPLDFCGAMLTFTLAAPIAFTHHYGFLVPVLWIVLVRILAGGESSRRLRLLLLGLAYLGLSHYIWPTRRLAATPLNFIQSYLYFGALIVLGLTYALRGERAGEAEAAAAAPGGRTPAAAGA